MKRKNTYFIIATNDLKYHFLWIWKMTEPYVAFQNDDESIRFANAAIMSSERQAKNILKEALLYDLWVEIAVDPEDDVIIDRNNVSIFEVKEISTITKVK